MRERPILFNGRICWAGPAVCSSRVANQRAGEIVRRAIGSAELLRSRYKISAGECRISAPGGPVLRYLVDLSRLRLTYSVCRSTHTPRAAALSPGQRPQPSSQCGAGQCHHARHGNRLAGGAADSRAIRLNGGRGHVQQLSGGTHGQSHVRLPGAEFSRRHADSPALAHPARLDGGRDAQVNQGVSHRPVRGLG